MSELSDARERWRREVSRYQQLVDQVTAVLRVRVREKGIRADVTGRVKGVSNLLKKMLKKGYSYDRVTDKAGARVVVRFRQDVKPLESAVERSFNVLKKDDKAEQYGHNEVGYSGVHYDVRLRSVLPEDAELGPLQCEIQLHTMCQSLWADMDHELSYKPALSLPHDVLRQIYLLNGHLEIADRSFSSISMDIMALPGANAMALLQNLERHFYRFTGETFDAQLSYQVLEAMLPLYKGAESLAISAEIEEFVDSNSTRLQSIFDEYTPVDDRPLLLFQPESFVLFEWIEKDPYRLEDLWTARYPREELARLAIAWGRPLD